MKALAKRLLTAVFLIAVSPLLLLAMLYVMRESRRDED